jgi:hypothetical protein
MKHVLEFCWPNLISYLKYLQLYTSVEGNLIIIIINNTKCFKKCFTMVFLMLMCCECYKLSIDQGVELLDSLYVFQS